MATKVTAGDISRGMKGEGCVSIPFTFFCYILHFFYFFAKIIISRENLLFHAKEDSISYRRLQWRS